MSEQLNELCSEMEREAEARGGICHSAGQGEWGIEPRQDDDDRKVWHLCDCDGEVWASGTEAEILARREALLAEARRCADESGWVEDEDEE